MVLRLLLNFVCDDKTRLLIFDVSSALPLFVFDQLPFQRNMLGYMKILLSGLYQACESTIFHCFLVPFDDHFPKVVDVLHFFCRYLRHMLPDIREKYQILQQLATLKLQQVGTLPYLRGCLSIVLLIVIFLQEQISC